MTTITVNNQMRKLVDSLPDKVYTRVMKALAKAKKDGDLEKYGWEHIVSRTKQQLPYGPLPMRPHTPVNYGPDRCSWCAGKFQGHHKQHEVGRYTFHTSCLRKATSVQNN